MSSEKDAGGAVVVDPLGGLILDPSNELRFKGPFDDYVTVSLNIKNPTEKRIAFKIKTTAPKRYCVKPNSGVLDSNQSMKVNVLLQPFTYDPNEKNKHKFMVQYMYLDEKEMQLSVNEILNMWKDVSGSRLLDLKLKCIFELNESEQQKVQQNDQTSMNAAPNVANSQQHKSSANSSSTSGGSASRQTSAAAKQAAINNSSMADIYSNADSQLSNNDFESMSSNATSLINASTLGNRSNVKSSSAAAGSRDQNDNKINELKLENETLKKEINRLKEEEVRLRKLALQSPSSSPSSRSSEASSPLADLLNNRLVLVIILLIAIIVYMMLFR